MTVFHHRDTESQRKHKSQLVTKLNMISIPLCLCDSVVEILSSGE